jgi:hypothetical protein
MVANSAFMKRTSNEPALQKRGKHLKFLEHLSAFKNDPCEKFAEFVPDIACTSLSSPSMGSFQSNGARDGMNGSANNPGIGTSRDYFRALPELISGIFASTLSYTPCRKDLLTEG